jgi:type I restriction enzyme S subunit
MNTIKELIEKYCPDGVEYKKLGEVCTFQRGTSLTSKNAIEGDIPVISGGQKPAFYHNVANREANSITVAGSGAYAGYVSFWNKPIFAADCFTVNPDCSILLIKYVYHYLLNIQEKIYVTKKGAGVPHVHGNDIAKFLIPVPPLPVQHEIVRILDNFTSLEAELEAELEARRKQYEYYRDQLLSFKYLSEGGTDEVEWKTLGEVAEIVGGRDYKQFNHGNIPVYGSGGIMTYIDTYAYDRPTVLLPRKGSISNVFYTDMPFWNVDTIFYTIIHNELLPKFFYYYMCNYHIERLNTSNAARPALTRTVLNNIPIPVPPLSEQRRIVSILDHFESLVNDITTGLPAEIAARRQQYEYYRDQLLSFKRKS